MPATSLIAVGQLGTALCLLAALSAPIAAQVADWLTDVKGENSGHAVCGFLSLPTSAVELSRGAASPAAEDATSLYAKTAASAFLTHCVATATHVEWLMGLRKEYAGAAFPLLGIGTVGGFANVFSAGSFDNARDINQDPSDVNYVECAVGASFAREILHKTLAAGLSASYVESRLDGSIGRTASVCGSVACEMEWLKAELEVANLGPRISYNGAPEPLPLSIGLTASVLPLAYRLVLEDKVGIDLTLGAHKVLDEPLLAGASAQVALLDALRLRLGWEYAVGEKPGAVGLSAGAGLRIDRYSADFGWRNQSDAIGSVWAVDVSVAIKEVLPKTAEEYYRIAEKHFRAGRLSLAIQYAVRATQLNPNMWKAQALIARARSQQRREQGSELALIYAGGCQGAMVPLAHGSETVGGLGRQAAIIASLRAQYPTSVALNIGNNIAAESPRSSVGLTDFFFGRVKFDAVCLGSGELNYGLTTMQADVRSIETIPVCTNAQTLLRGTKARDAFVQTGRRTIMVLSVVAPEMVIAEPARFHLNKTVDALRKRLKEPDALKASLRVVVVNDTWENVKTLARSVTNVDFIVCSGISQRFSAPMRVGSTAILSCGDSGQAVGALSLRFDDRGKLLSFDNALYPLTDNVTPDRVIEARAQELAFKTALAEAGIDEDSLSRGSVDGVLLFDSDRAKVPGVYLKVIHRTAEFPLTAGMGACFRPRGSFACGKVVFLALDLVDDRTALFSMNFAGSEKQRLCPDIDVTDAAFSPDGEWIYATGANVSAGSCGISRTKADGSACFPVIEWKGSVEKDIALAPDMSLMAWCSNRDRTWQIYVSSPTGEHPMRITDANADHTQLQFSPDGRFLAFVSDRATVRGKEDVWIYDTRTSRMEPLTHHDRVTSYCWMGDSRRIVCASGLDRTQLSMIDVVDLTQSVLIGADSARTYSETAPTTMQYKGATKIVYSRVYESEDGIRKELWWVDPDGTGDALLARSKRSSWRE